MLVVILMENPFIWLQKWVLASAKNMPTPEITHAGYDNPAFDEKYLVSPRAY
jgi:hypothetical protein